MTKFNIFNSIKKNTKKEILFNCPSCGAKCNVEESICSECSYDLKDYKDILFTGYIYLDLALAYCEKNKYQDALIEISKFIALFPNDEDGNKLYIYLLSKNGMYERVKAELEVFEKNFPMNPFIMDVEKNGIENIDMPKFTHQEIKIEKPVASLLALRTEYTMYRIKNTNEIVDLAMRFYDLIALLKAKQSISKKYDYSSVISFYEKNFLSFLSKKEIRIESYNGKIYSELSNEELEYIDVIGTICDKKKKEGEILTIYPAMFLRSKMISIQKVQVNKLTK